MRASALRPGDVVLDVDDRECVVEWGDSAWWGSSWLHVIETGAERRLRDDYDYRVVRLRSILPTGGGEISRPD